MAASSKLMIGEAERRFPVRIKLALPAGGFGTRLTEINAWLDANCGADAWAMTPAGLRGVVNGRNLFPRCDDRRRFRCPLVRHDPDRDHRRGISDARG